MTNNFSSFIATSAIEYTENNRVITKAHSLLRMLKALGRLTQDEYDYRVRTIENANQNDLEDMLDTLQIREILEDLAEENLAITEEQYSEVFEALQIGLQKTFEDNVIALKGVLATLCDNVMMTFEEVRGTDRLTQVFAIDSLIENASAMDTMVSNFDTDTEDGQKLHLAHLRFGSIIGMIEGTRRQCKKVGLPYNSLVLQEIQDVLLSHEHDFVRKSGESSTRAGIIDAVRDEERRNGLTPTPLTEEQKQIIAKMINDQASRELSDPRIERLIRTVNRLTGVENDEREFSEETKVRQQSASDLLAQLGIDDL